jgi:hypothetical protein
MQPGDLVRKVGGDSDLGKTGLITSIQTNTLGVKILCVTCSEYRHALAGSHFPTEPPSVHKNWLAKYCEIISEIS